MTTSRVFSNAEKMRVLAGILPCILLAALDQDGGGARHSAKVGRRRSGRPCQTKSWEVLHGVLYYDYPDRGNTIWRGGGGLKGSIFKDGKNAKRSRRVE